MRTTGGGHIPATGLAETLFSDYRRRVLGLLLLRPEEAFHVRQIARLTSIPSGSLHRELKVLSEAGLLARFQAGNKVRYQANPDCVIYSELASIIVKICQAAQHQDSL